VFLAPPPPSLPLTNNRNFQSLSMTVPGITRPPREHSQFFNSQDSLRYEVNGQPGMASNTLIEGLDDNQKTGLLQVIIPAADALEDRQHRRPATTTRSSALGRRGHQRDAEVGHQRPQGQRVLLRQQREDQRRRLLLALEGADQVRQRRLHARRADRQEQAVLLRRLPAHARQQRLRRPATVPTLAMRNGDFSAVGARSTIRSPATSRRNGPLRAATSSPQDRISPIARSCWRSFPSRIIAARARPEQLPEGAGREKTTDGFDAKVNYTISAKDQMSVPRQLHAAGRLRSRACSAVRRAGNGGLRRHRHEHQQQPAVHLDARLRPQTVLDVRGGLNYYHNVTSTQGTV
jgi:hypothetical protein